MTRETITGQPETPADTRHRELREGGYRGPVDQTGRENHDHDDVFESLDRNNRQQGTPGY